LQQRKKVVYVTLLVDDPERKKSICSFSLFEAHSSSRRWRLCIKEPDKRTKSVREEFAASATYPGISYYLTDSLFGEIALVKREHW